jgi:hypothetical protein
MVPVRQSRLRAHLPLLHRWFDLRVSALVGLWESMLRQELSLPDQKDLVHRL